MTARLIQTNKLSDKNRAEKELLSFLKELPNGYTVYRELQLNRAYEDRVRGMEKAQPDFVVVGTDIGLLSVEVKDWNLIRNQYIWQDQFKVIKKTQGETDVKIDNPAAQANTYRYAFMELIDDIKVWVTSVVAFPRLSRQAFLNKIANIALLQNPQSKFFLDLETVIFKEDIDEFFMNPDALLKRIVRKKIGFRPATEHGIYAVNERLLPNEFRIGDLTKRQQEREHLKMITTQQEKWIFDLNHKSGYLLDVAGSGKTNALVSRAIYIIEQAYKRKENAPRILLTTYNPNLQRNIERILEGKIKLKDRHTRYKSLKVENVEFIMERIATTGYGFKHTKEYFELNPPGTLTYSQILQEDVRAALQDNPDRYRVFDYILIDEIQDFDDKQLYLVRRLARTDNFFFVGDIGQKIYDRHHDLKRHGFIIDELDLPKSYKMYRTPQYIGELAYQFIMADTTIRSEFEEHGYRQDTQFESYNENAAEVLQVQDSIPEVVERIHSLLSGQYTEDSIMVITSKALLPAYEIAFKDAGIRFSIGEPKHTEQISLVDFMNVKGLEREVVFVSDIEDLYTQQDGLFDDPATQVKQERFSRHKIYVALTRAIEECIVYYTNPSNVFVSELVAINRKIMNKR